MRAAKLHDAAATRHNHVVDHPRKVPFWQNKRDLNDVDEPDVEVECGIEVEDVVAGEHMTVVLDTDGGVWTCGRNACGALGRETRSEGFKVHSAGQNAFRVRSEVEPDMMRKVVELDSIDWIGCGSTVWFAHNQRSGAVYSFGDASSGRAGVGRWHAARGRPVFDEHNLRMDHLQVVRGTGGSDHAIFVIKRQKVEWSSLKQAELARAASGKPSLTRVATSYCASAPQKTKTVKRTRPKKMESVDEEEEEDQPPPTKKRRVEKEEG